MFNVVCFLLYCMPVMPCLSEVLKNLFDLLYFILSLLMVGWLVRALFVVAFTFIPLSCHLFPHSLAPFTFCYACSTSSSSSVQSHYRNANV